MGRGASGGANGGMGSKSRRVGDASMRGYSARLSKAIGSRESAIRQNQAYEQISIFDKNGNEVFHNDKGQAHSVEYDGRKATGNIITHNHPSGSSFSGIDVVGAVKFNAAEMRAVSKNYTFSLKPGKSGWGTSSRGADYGYRKYEGQVKSKLWSYINNYKGDRQTAVNRAETLHAYLIMKGLSKEAGWSYTKTKVN